jgi:hypothetical protein
MKDFLVSTQCGGAVVKDENFSEMRHAIAFLATMTGSDRFAYGRDENGGRPVVCFALAGGPVTLTDAGVLALREEVASA